MLTRVCTATGMALLLSLAMAGASDAQRTGEEKPFVVYGESGGVEAKFDVAKGLQTVEFGRPEPLGPGLRFEVLVETERGGKKVQEWQTAGNANSRFFVDAPKVSFGPDQPLGYFPGFVELPGTNRFRVHPGSYGQYTADPDLPVILSQRGENNLATVGFVASSRAEDAKKLFAALGADVPDAADIGLVYVSSAKQPMVLATVTCRGVPVLGYKPWEEGDANDVPAALRGLIGRFVEHDKPDKPIDLKSPNGASTLAEFLEQYKMQLVVGARFISPAELLGRRADDTSNRGFSLRVVFSGAAGRGADDPKGPALTATWVTDEGKVARVDWFDAATGKQLVGK